MFAASIVLVVAFAFWELRNPHPMFDFKYLRNPRFSVGSMAIGISFFALFGFIFGATQYLQFVKGFSPLEAGAAILPAGFGMVIGAGSSHRLVTRIGTKLTVVWGMSLLTLMLSLMLLFQPDTPYIFFGGFVLITTYAMGNIMAPSTDSVMGAVSEAKAGIGSAMNDVARPTGGAMGVAAFLAHGLDSKCPREPLRHVYLGPGFETFEIKSFLSQEGCPFQEYEEPKLLEETARLLAEGKVVGWFQGRMEWGPRALGNRSILADPRREDMKDILNQKVKWREPFRPFAPAIVLEEGPAYFEMDGASPFMLFTYPVKRPQDIPAVTHVDGSSRVQTVAEEENPRFYKLLKAFQHVAGVPVLINTSFNLRGEPIVCTPVEAYDSFMKTDIDVLVLDRFIIKKREDL